MSSEHDSSPLRHLPAEMCDLIFQHLSGELLTVSEVSPSFCNFVTGSKRRMKGIRLELTSEVPEDAILLDSRNYERLLLGDKKHVERSRKLLSEPGRTWKDVTINGVDFETVNDVLDYLRLFQSSVEKLSLNRVFVERNFDPISELPSSGLEFPNLKSLEMICSFATFYDAAFVNCKNLTSFSIKSGGSMGDTSLNAIRTILKTNGGLKFLKIDYEVFYLLFGDDFSGETSFKLREFHAKSLQRPLGNQTQVRQNLNSFLMAQGETVETLTLGKWMGGDVFKTILSMPRLKQVTLMGFQGVESAELQSESFPKISSVKRLDLSDFWKDEVVRFMLEVFPRVEDVTITGTADQASSRAAQVSSAARN